VNRLQRYLTAWSRHHRSGGFGIHSPFAYNFVREVLRQRLPYYAYERLAQAHDTVVAATTRQQRRDLRLVSLAQARLLFRITNYFNPPVIVQVGSGGCIDTLAMMSVNSNSRLLLLDPDIERHPATVRVLQPLLPRIDCYDDAAVAVADATAAAASFVLVDWVDDEAMHSSLQPLVDTLLQGNGVMIVRDLDHNSLNTTLWQQACEEMTAGQTFTNGKLGIVVSRQGLPVQHFDLWL